MRTPTTYEVCLALEKALFAALGEAVQAGGVVIVQPGAESAPDLKKIQVLHTVKPGEVQSGELGGRQGLSLRTGVYSITLSCPPNDATAFAEAWRLTGVLEKALYRASLPIADSEGVVACKEPLITNVGETADKRLALSVSLPWWVWTGGYEGE